MVGIILIIFLIIWIIAGNYFYNSILNRKTATLKYLNIFNENEKKLKNELNKQHYNYLKEETLIDEIKINSFDKTKLYSRYIKNKGNKWVILQHGYLDNGSTYYPLARFYYDLGFNVLLIDIRSHGKSGGKFITMGKYESMDIKYWIKFIKSKSKKPQIIIHGISMGAFITLLSSKYATKDVKLLISEGSYTSIKNILNHQIGEKFGIITMPIYMMGSFITKLRTGVNINDVSALTTLRENEIPTVFIHSAKDSTIPEYMVKELYNANKGLKEMHILEGKHSLLSITNKEKYHKIIKEGIKKYIK